MKKYIFILFILAFSNNAFSQDYLEALKFSQQNYEGTARFTSMGGAFGALGGDFTSLSLNPAGVGVYRSSEFTITPSVTYNKVNSDYMHITTPDSRTRLDFSNVGYVGSFMTGNEQGLVSFNFGVGYTKTANFYRNTSARGSVSSASIMDYFLEKSGYKIENGFFNPEDLGSDNVFRNYHITDWDMGLAFHTGVLQWNNEDGAFEAPITGDDKVIQSRYSTQSGTNGEYVFSFGGNVSNKFYFGATFGVHDLYHENGIEYIENAVSGNSPKFSSLYYDRYYRTVGTGYSGKFGIIYRPVSDIRLGVAFHTPTFYYMTRTYDPYMESVVEGGDWNFQPRDPYIIDYRLQSPLRAIASFAYTIGKVGLLSIDYEYVNYSGMKLNDPNRRGLYSAENLVIKDNIRGTSNIRVGGEAWVSNNFALRAGFIYNESPEKNKDFDMSMCTYSAGIGYKYQNFFADFAYALSSTKDYYNNYGYGDVYSPLTTEKENRSRFMLTLGFRF